MEQKKPTVWSVIAKVMAVSAFLSVLGVAIGGFIEYGKNQEEQRSYREAQKEVTFKDSEERHDVVDLLTIDYHPFKIAKTQDALGIKLNRVDTLISSYNKQKIIDSKYKKTQDSIENLREIKVQKNRDKKYKLQAKMLDQLILIKVELRGMNERIDSLKK